MSGYKVTTSSELMENYIQADFLDPQDTFIALQTDAGASLLFSIGTDGAFYLTIEEPGRTNGWRQVDLGSKTIREDFAGKAMVKTFGAAQAVLSQANGRAQIHLAMVVDDGKQDHLYLSLANSDADLSWADDPVWVAAPFNAVDSTGAPIKPPDPLLIPNVFLSEATDAEYVVADIIRNPGEAGTMITRYFLDVSTPSAPKWTLHDLAIDLRATGYSSCLGRSAHAYGVDGIYTKGLIGSSAQLIYTPLYNVFDRTLPPLPSRLYLPGGTIADAIAAARNPDNSSDLYVAARGSLYWFAGTNQKDGATGLLVTTSPLLDAVRSLYAYTADGSITVWGLNGEDQVFYLTCPVGQQQTPTAWNVPLPIMTDVDAVSPFIDRGYSANTVFAHTGTGPVKVVKSPTTGLWNRTLITLPPAANTTPATPIHTYTTHIQVTDPAGQGAGNVAVTVTATNVTAVYVNHLYYVIGPSPIHLTTDATGSITIVERTTTLAGTRFQVAVASEPVISVNTLDTAWERNAGYTTTDKLRSAKIVERDGSTRDFVPAGTSDQDLQNVAESNKKLAQAYKDVQSAPPQKVAAWKLTGPTSAALQAEGLGDGLAVDIGDLFSWLESGLEAAVDLFKDLANEAWHFVVTIGETVYHGVLDCVEAVVAAATWVYNAIKVAIEDVIKFLEFLFGWQDILVTHRVLKNVFLCLGRGAVDGIDATKAQIASTFQDIQSKIDSWAGIADFTQTAQSTLGTAKPVAGQHSAPANLGVHHFSGGAASSSSDLSPVRPVEAIFDDLLAMVEAEGETLAAAAKAIKTDIIDQFDDLSVGDLIRRLLAITADTVIQSAENVMVTALDVFAQLVREAIALLDAKIDFPVLSWLYRLLTGDDLSFLDLICLVVSIPVTVIYKAASGKTPFPESDSFTQGLLSATSLAQIQALFVVDRPALAGAPEVMALAGSDDAVMDQDRLKTFAFATGIASTAGAVVLVYTSNVQRVADLIGLPIYAKTLAAVACVGNIAYVSPNVSTLVNAAEGNWYAQVNNSVTSVSLLKGIAAIPAAASNNPKVGKGFAFVESFINLVWNIPLIANIVDHEDVFDTSYKSLIPESIGNFAFNVGGILEFPIAMLDEDLRAKAALALVQAGLMAAYGIFMTVAGSIYRFADGQEH